MEENRDNYLIMVQGDTAIWITKDVVPQVQASVGQRTLSDT